MRTITKKKLVSLILEQKRRVLELDGTISTYEETNDWPSRYWKDVHPKFGKYVWDASKDMFVPVSMFNNSGDIILRKSDLGKNFSQYEYKKDIKTNKYFYTDKIGTNTWYPMTGEGNITYVENLMSTLNKNNKSNQSSSKLSTTVSYKPEKGDVVTLKADSPEYQKWLYGEGQSYKWDGQKQMYVIDYSKIFKNWNTMTQQERDIVIDNRLGKVKSGPITGTINSIGEVASYLGNIIWQNLTFDNIVYALSKIAPFFPPPIGGKATEKMLQLIQGVAYFIRYIYSEKMSDKAANFLSGFLSVLEFLEIRVISFLPTTIKNSMIKIEKWFFANIAKIARFIKKRNMAQWLQITLIFLVKNVGREITNKINDFVKSITQNILTPIFNFIFSVNETLGNIIKSVIQTLNEFAANLDSVNDFYEATKDEQIDESNKKVIFIFKKKDLQVIT